MSDDDDDRLAVLESENAALRAELARLRPPPPEPPRLDGPFRMPDASQMGRLVNAVLLKYPSLRDRNIDDAELIQMTATAFRFFAGLPRTPGRLDLRHDLLSWIGFATDALQAIGQSATIRGPALHVAAVACGDVPHLPPRLFPSAGFGVCLLGIMRGSRPATNAWLRVLDHQFDERLVVEPPNVGAFHPVSKVFDLTAPVNLAPNTAWRDGM
jgi:hypothetical protein